MDEEKYPEVQGGGSLILAWQIRNKRVLVVGGGEASLLNRPLLFATDNLPGRRRTHPECPQRRRQSDCRMPS
jgi:hypothetical protein